MWHSRNHPPASLEHQQLDIVRKANATEACTTRAALVSIERWIFWEELGLVSLNPRGLCEASFSSFSTFSMTVEIKGSLMIPTSAFSLSISLLHLGTDFVQGRNDTMVVWKENRVPLIAIGRRMECPPVREHHISACTNL